MKQERDIKRILKGGVNKGNSFNLKKQYKEEGDKEWWDGVGMGKLVLIDQTFTSDKDDKIINGNMKMKLE